MKVHALNGPISAGCGKLKTKCGRMLDPVKHFIFPPQSNGKYPVKHYDRNTVCRGCFPDFDGATPEHAATKGY